MGKTVGFIVVAVVAFFFVLGARAGAQSALSLGTVTSDTSSIPCPKYANGAF